MRRASQPADQERAMHKTMLPFLVLAAGFAHAQPTGDPVVAPKATERFLEGVREFADGQTVPGRKDPEPLSYPNPAGPTPPAARVQKPSGPNTKSTLQGQIIEHKPIEHTKIERPVIVPEPATGQKYDPAWR
jgi:hypothetical protein